MKKLQVTISFLAILVLIAGGIVLTTQVTMAAPICGDSCSVNNCPNICLTCTTQAWCCNGWRVQRCAENDPLCQYSYCVHWSRFNRRRKAPVFSWFLGHWVSAVLYLMRNIHILSDDAAGSRDQPLARTWIASSSSTLFVQHTYLSQLCWESMANRFTVLIL